MPILLQPLAHSRHSRRRARNLRARGAVVAACLLLIVYLLWHPVVPTRADIAPRYPSTQYTPAIDDAEPEQSIDTEGALSGWQEISDAALYVADR